MTYPLPDHRLFKSARMLIGGEWRDTTTDHLVHRDPSTGKILGEFAAGGPAEIDLAIRAARDALPRWRDQAPTARRDILLKATELVRARSSELATIAAHETGTVFNAVAPARAAEHLAYYAGWADKLNGSTTDFGPGILNYTRHEPYGIIAALTSWNGPVTSALMKLGPALAAGNCIILKPPELGPFSSLLLAEIMLEAGLPAGVLNVVTGGAIAGEALVGDPRIGKITFTGGLATARHVLRSAAQHATPVVTELGGKSANIVFADCDLDRAAGMAATMGCLVHAGQGCLFPTRLLVHNDVYSAVEERVLSLVRNARIGNPFEPGVTSGPVINGAAVERIMAVVDAAKSQGHGKLLSGGNRLGGDLAAGYFIEPTVFGDVDNASPLAQQEIFGPVLSLIRFGSEEEAVALANDTSFGLAGYIHTRDLGRAHRVAAQLEAGYIGVNGFPPMPVQAPFGGFKQSGSGREGGREGIEEFLRPKNIYITL